eukprot:CAMPEP_0184325910 /NCGR_PEP_ID=MMETSP1049-20130417/142271_1 /TAXON_ID=77928 /ORGANISM="Proteomonas sulcata, Strain CCMP704" /LENGTH=66 /DNA_ID=CAMNT_0026648075 /DNA_START=770 /DNA_END=970 /DNA_ORIENTATION=+
MAWLMSCAVRFSFLKPSWHRAAPTNPSPAPMSINLIESLSTWLKVSDRALLHSSGIWYPHVLTFSS